MTYDTYCTEAECVVRIGGDVDITCAPLLNELEREVATPRSIVVDVAGLRYADTTFLRFLLRLRDHANATNTGAVRLVGASKNLRRLLDITGLRRYFAE